MPIQFDCVKCGKRLKVADSAAGKGVRCPNCEQVMRIPGGGKPKPNPSPKPPAAPTPATPPSQDPLSHDPLSNDPLSNDPLGHDPLADFSTSYPSSSNPVQSPYASPQYQPSSPQYGRTQRGNKVPDRGGLCLGLAIGSIFVSLAGFLCCPLFSLVSFGMSIPAWVMASKDLTKMKQGIVSSNNRGLVVAAKVVAIVSVCISAILLILTVVFIILHIAIALNRG